MTPPVSVRLLAQYRHAGEARAEGDVIEVPPETAAGLFAARRATPADARSDRRLAGAPETRGG